MAFTSFKALLFLGGCTAMATTAYVLDIFEPYIAGLRASLSEPAQSADSKTASLPTQEHNTATPPPASTAAVTPEILLPSFDVVRVESDGSGLIAGRAAPNAKVEIVSGERVLGNAIAGPGGDFVIVIEEPLKPGGYKLALRSTMPDHTVTTSLETANISIPEKEGEQVLALVEQRGEPSKQVTVPESSSTYPAAAPAEQLKSDVAAARAESSPSAPPAGFKVAVDALEIDGRKIFLAGVAAPGRQVRGYIGDILLGQANASPAGRVLIEAELDIPVGDHVVHIEELEPDGVTAAGASVLFRREPGANMAAIATTAPDAATSGPLRSDSGAAVSAVSERLAPKLQHVEGAVIIRRGDTLWRISHRVYGRGVRYSTIYLANQTQISNPNRIWPGQVFNIPERSREGEVANLKALGKQAAQTSMP